VVLVYTLMILMFVGLNYKFCLILVCLFICLSCFPLSLFPLIQFLLFPYALSCLLWDFMHNLLISFRKYTKYIDNFDARLSYYLLDVCVCSFLYVFVARILRSELLGFWNLPIFRYSRNQKTHWLALSKGPNRLGASPSHFTWGRKQMQFPKRFVFYQ
jgi:hypothetical protein